MHKCMCLCVLISLGGVLCREESWRAACGDDLLGCTRKVLGAWSPIAS